MSTPQPAPGPRLQPARAEGGEAAAPPLAEPCISSHQLLGDAKEVFIDHHGAIYRLRETSLGKLILTK